MNQSAWMRLLIVGVMMSTGVAGNAVLAADNDEQQPVLIQVLSLHQKLLALSDKK